VCRRCGLSWKQGEKPPVCGNIGVPGYLVDVVLAFAALGMLLLIGG
jgi:hypothetical protein